MTLVGARGRMPHVRIVGPTRSIDQVELSRSDEVALGCDAPLRESGDLAGTPGIVIEGPAGHVALQRGVIRALRHIHMSPAAADVLDLKDHDSVSVAIVSGLRRLIFRDIVVRVSSEYTMELHLDSDEGNATGLRTGDEVMLEAIGVAADESGLD